MIVMDQEDFAIDEFIDGLNKSQDYCFSVSDSFYSSKRLPFHESLYNVDKSEASFHATNQGKQPLANIDAKDLRYIYGDSGRDILVG